MDGRRVIHDMNGFTNNNIFNDARVNIMYVEDDENCHVLVKEVLRPFDNVRFVSKYNSKDALEYIQSGKSVDVILLDLTLPDEHGFEFINKLWRFSDSSYKSIPIIIISADDSMKTFKKCQQLKIDLVSKPLSIIKFLKIFSKYKKFKMF